MTLVLIDTSALMRAGHELVGERLNDLIVAGVAATCTTVELEVGYSARSADALRQNRMKRSKLFVSLPVDERAARRALAVQQFLANAGLHRAAGPIDLLTAAVAELNNAVVMHYDADFEHIASVTRQRHEWVVPRGSVD